MSIKIIIADDHPITRNGLAMLLSQKDGITVVAEDEKSQIQDVFLSKK